VTDHEFGTSATKAAHLELATLMSRLKPRLQRLSKSQTGKSKPRE